MTKTIVEERIYLGLQCQGARFSDDWAQAAGGRHDRAREKVNTHILIHKHKAEKSRREFLKVQQQGQTPSNMVLPLKPLQIAPCTGDQVFRCLRPGRTSHSNHCKNQRFYELLRPSLEPHIMMVTEMSTPHLPSDKYSVLSMTISP